MESKILREILAVLLRIEQCVVVSSEKETLETGNTDQTPTVTRFKSSVNRMTAISELNISPSTYTRWKNKGILKVDEVGNRDYISRENLERARIESIRRGKI